MKKIRTKIGQTLLVTLLLLTALLTSFLLYKAVDFRLKTLPNLAEVLLQETEGFITVNNDTLDIFPPYFAMVYTNNINEFLSEIPESNSMRSSVTMSTIEETASYQNVRGRLPYFKDGFAYGNTKFFQSIFPAGTNRLQKLAQVSPYFGSAIRVEPDQIYLETFFAIDKTQIDKVDSTSLGIPESVDIHCQLLEESAILSSLFSKCEKIVSTQKFFDDGIFARTVITLKP